jgi:hypothetical protein
VGPGLSVDQLVSALQRKGVPLPFELGTFLVLEASERVALEPSLVRGSDLRIADDGELSLQVREADERPSPREACRALSTLLGELLVCSAQSVPPRLLRLVEPGLSGDGVTSPAALRDELEATLVPLNRAAMRRVLARLVREARRELDLHGRRSSAAPHADAELDAILAGGDDAPARRARSVAPPAKVTAASAAGAQALGDADISDLDAVLDGLGGDRETPGPAHRTPRASHAPVGPERASEQERPLHAPREGESIRAPRALAHGDQRDTLDSFEHSAGSSGNTGARVGLLLMLCALALAGGYFLLGRDASRRAIGLPEAALPTSPSKAPTPQAPLHGELRVRSSPPRAQVFLRVGSGPTVVAHLPVGIAHEFIALRAGFAPSRALVPKTAEWRAENGELRYELALQLPETTAPGREQELGASLLRDPPGQPTGALGSVRVVTSPPGAEVYQLVGFTPDVKVANVVVSEPLELLLWLPQHPPRHVQVAASDWKPEGGSLVADIDVDLGKTGPRSTAAR